MYDINYNNSSTHTVVDYDLKTKLWIKHNKLYWLFGRDSGLAKNTRRDNFIGKRIDLSAMNTDSDLSYAFFVISDGLVLSD